jgi:hypothetical protein
MISQEEIALKVLDDKKQYYKKNYKNRERVRIQSKKRYEILKKEHELIKSISNLDTSILEKIINIIKELKKINKDKKINNDKNNNKYNKEKLKKINKDNKDNKDKKINKDKKSNKKINKDNKEKLKNFIDNNLTSEEINALNLIMENNI